MIKVAVVLSGCGVKDGSEIHEATLTLLHLAQAGAEYKCFAPNRPLPETINHISGQSGGYERNMLLESARIARGEIEPLENLDVASFDAVIFPGGLGAAKNLSTWFSKGPEGEVLPEVEAVIRSFRKAGKPQGFICIAPNLAALVLGKEGVRLTIGRDPGTAQAIERTGAKHVECEVGEIEIDRNLKIVSTPAYMLGPTIADVNEGIGKLVLAVLEMA